MSTARDIVFKNYGAMENIEYFELISRFLFDRCFSDQVPWNDSRPRETRS